MEEDDVIHSEDINYFPPLPIITVDIDGKSVKTGQYWWVHYEDGKADFCVLDPDTEVTHTFRSAWISKHTTEYKSADPTKECAVSVRELDMTWRKLD